MKNIPNNFPFDYSLSGIIKNILKNLTICLQVKDSFKNTFGSPFIRRRRNCLPELPEDFSKITHKCARYCQFFPKSRTLQHTAFSNFAHKCSDYAQIGDISHILATLNCLLRCATVLPDGPAGIQLCYFLAHAGLLATLAEPAYLVFYFVEAIKGRLVPAAD